MLVLTRKSEQKIIIGNNIGCDDKNIVITILKVQGDQVSIGIKAPKKTLIYREEIYKEIEKANTGGAVSKDSVVDVKVVAKNLKQEFQRSSPHAQKIAEVSHSAAPSSFYQSTAVLSSEERDSDSEKERSDSEREHSDSEKEHSNSEE